MKLDFHATAKRHRDLANMTRRSELLDRDNDISRALNTVRFGNPADRDFAYTLLAERDAIRKELETLV